MLDIVLKHKKWSLKIATYQSRIAQQKSTFTELFFVFICITRDLVLLMYTIKKKEYTVIYSMICFFLKT